MVAVMIVASVGSTVDYKKEVAFVKSRLASIEKNVVSTPYPVNSTRNLNKRIAVYFVYFIILRVKSFGSISNNTFTERFEFN